MSELSPIQIDKIMNATKEIGMLSREQDIVFEKLLSELNLSENQEAIDWLFDICYNQDVDIDRHIKHINELI
jgi:hypothetical protein